MSSNFRSIDLILRNRELSNDRPKCHSVARSWQACAVRCNRCSRACGRSCIGSCLCDLVGPSSVFTVPCALFGCLIAPGEPLGARRGPSHCQRSPRSPVHATHVRRHSCTRRRPRAHHRRTRWIRRGVAALAGPCRSVACSRRTTRSNNTETPSRSR
jgi:hypothetical protein